MRREEVEAWSRSSSSGTVERLSALPNMSNPAGRCQCDGVQNVYSIRAENSD